MRLTLHHDGDPKTAKIVDAETGEPLQRIIEWSVHHTRDDPTERLSVTVLILPADMEQRESERKAKSLDRQEGQA